MTDISVIICTRDRCELLQRTIELLARQSIPAGKRFEIIIVDNDSSDATAQVVKQLQRSISIPLAYAVEPRVGLARARNRGMRMARGDILVFTDDDMIFSDSWLRALCDLFACTPVPACVTGPVEVHRDSHPSLQPEIRKGRRRYRYPCEPWEVGRGNNMSFARRYLERAGAFDTRLGAGTASGSGEDVDMFYRILKLGGEIVFDPEVSAYHDHRRHVPEEIEAVVRNYAVGGTAFLVKYAVRFDVFALKLLYWKYLSFRRGVEKAGDDRSYAPPVGTVQRIYMKGYFAGLLRGVRNLFERT
jgi:glycosyltransferase involved in cell wall biosynthesis